MAGSVTEPGRPAVEVAGPEGTASPGVSAQPDQESSEGMNADMDAGRDERGSPAELPLALVVAVIAAITPVVVAAVRAVGRDWVPVSDPGYVPIRARDVLTGHPPLTGSPASASDQVGQHLYQPGPLQYDLLALPVRLLGRGPGTALGIALVNIVAILGIAWLVRRRCDSTAATVAMAGCALLAWSMGSEILYDPWPTYSPLFALALFVVAVWCLVAGDAVAVPVVVVAGSYVAQVHLSFAVVVAGLAAFAVVAALARLVRARRRDPASWPQLRMKALRWSALGVVLGLACWAQPLWQELAGSGDGNLSGLLRSTDSGLPTPGLAKSLRALGGTLAVPPMWLAPSFGHPSFDPDGSGRPLWLAAGGLAVLVGLLAALGIRAWRRGSTALAAGAATALVGIALGLVTVLRMPMTFGLIPHYTRWMWPLGMVVWVVLVLLVIDEAAKLRQNLGHGLISGRRAMAGFRLTFAVAAVAVVAAAAALPTVHNESSTPPWTVAAVHDLAPDMIAAVRDQGTIVVDVPLSWPTILAGPPLLGELQDAGIDFTSYDEIVVRQVGNHIAARPGEAQTRLSIRGGPPQPRADETLVASWSALSVQDRDELAQLTDELAEVIEDRGLRLLPETTDVLVALRQPAFDAEQATSDPQALLAGGALVALCCGQPADYVGHSLVDTSDFPPGLLERWAELADLRDTAQLSVYVSPEP